MTYSITWTTNGQSVTETFDVAADFYETFDGIEEQGCTITSYTMPESDDDTSNA